jgi:hypothetical protein
VLSIACPPRMRFRHEPACHRLVTLRPGGRQKHRFRHAGTRSLRSHRGRLAGARGGPRHLSRSRALRSSRGGSAGDVRQRRRSAPPDCVLGGSESADWLAVFELIRARGSRAPEPPNGLRAIPEGSRYRRARTGRSARRDCGNAGRRCCRMKCGAASKSCAVDVGDALLRWHAPPQDRPSGISAWDLRQRRPGLLGLNGWDSGLSNETSAIEDTQKKPRSGAPRSGADGGCHSGSW